MNESNVSRFFEKVQENKELSGKYRSVVSGAVRTSVWPAIAELATEQGLAFSTEELENWLIMKQGELSDEALEGISAGALGGRGSGVGTPSWWVPAVLGSVIIVGVGFDSGGDYDRDAISP